MAEAGIGLMVQPRSRYETRIPTFPYWAADNGCFSDRWEETSWLDWLDRLPRDGCLFAVAPDVYPDAQATLDRSARYFELMREMGFPVALVAQDGADQLSMPWDDFDCLFLGGEKRDDPRDEWKLGIGAEQLARVARRQGKWVHMGRVNSKRRIERAREMGCNSADGTFLKYRRRASGHGERDERGLPEMQFWYRWLDDNQTLFSHETPSHPAHRDALRRRGVA